MGAIRWIRCYKCHGTKVRPTTDANGGSKTCDHCNGKGIIKVNT